MKILYRVANAKVGSPVLPRNEADPARQFGNLRSARANLRRRVKRIKQGMRQLIDTLQPTLVTNAATYTYDIDAAKYSQINLFIQRLLYSELLDNRSGEFTSRWWLNANLSIAFEDGTADALQSAKNMAQVDVVGTELSQAMRSINIEQVMFSPGYMRRVGLVHARTFNDMKGLSDSSKVDLAGTLARSMAAGDGIRQITKDILSRVDVVESRAWRIARTEILNAYRTASWDETDELNEQVYGDSDWQMSELWFSALAPTSRPNHVSRHGKTYTSQEVREFYSVNGNAINCLCSQSPILMNVKTGEVIQQELLDKMKARREKYQAARGISG